MGSHLRQIDCIHLPRETHTWTDMSMSLSVCRIRLHPLTLNSPDTEVYLPVSLTARLPPPMLCKFWPQFISNCVLLSLPQLQHKLSQIGESEPLQVADNQLSFQPWQMVTFKWNPYLSMTARVNRGIKEPDDPNLTFVLLVKNWSEEEIFSQEIGSSWNSSSRAEIWAVHEWCLWCALYKTNLFEFD